MMFASDLEDDRPRRGRDADNLDDLAFQICHDADARRRAAEQFLSVLTSGHAALRGG